MPSLVALDIVLNNMKKEKLEKIKLNRNSSKLDTSPQSGRERFLIFSTQVPKMRYQPTINLTWNQLRINLAFCVQSFGFWFPTQE
jgi:hypothetical protein